MKSLNLRFSRTQNCVQQIAINNKWPGQRTKSSYDDCWSVGASQSLSATKLQNGSNVYLFKVYHSQFSSKKTGTKVWPSSGRLTPSSWRWLMAAKMITVNWWKSAIYFDNG